MNGQQILDQVVSKSFDVLVATKAGDSAERIATLKTQVAGEIDQAVVSQWGAQSAAATSEQRAQIALRLRQALVAGQTGGSPSLATTAALIDMLEA